MKMEEILKEYSKFRDNMGVPIDKKLVYRFWEKKELENLNRKDINIDYINNSFSEKKIEIAKKYLRYLILFDWVKFVAISGSIASSFAKEDDDIDIFIVVKNDRVWIYRGLILFENIFHGKVRIGDSRKDVKDKLCLNFITEERSISVDSDIFNLNEIISLIPIYNEKYFNTLMRKNNWLFTNFGISKKVLKEYTSEEDSNKRYPILSVLNYIFFFPQLLYMKILKHNPDYKRLIRNQKKGRIEFFREDFKKEKLNALIS